MKGLFFVDTNLWKTIEGKDLLINKMTLDCQNGFDIVMECEISNTQWIFRFQNVSAFRIQNMNYPVSIDGFEIIDHQSAGWECFSRYRVHDYEDGIIDFYCQDIDLLAAVR